MATLSSFTFITLNGFYKGADNDISWHQHGGEEAAFSAESAQSGNTLLFGRITYEMMYSFWPTPMAKENFPEVAEGMNKCKKIVFSRTMQQADWHNTSVIQQNMVEAVTNLKATEEKNMTILGSGSIITQLTEARLIDDYFFMLDPVALGKGSSLFSGITNQLSLQLVSQRAFKSGVLLLQYKPR